MRTTIAFSILLIPVSLPGNAQQVHKCTKGRDVSYQSAPCDRTQRLVKQWEAAPEPELPAAELSKRPSKGRQPEANSAGERTQSRRHGRTASSINANGNRCKAAKARREAKFIAVGLKRSIDLLRKLDEAVHEACK